MKIDCSCKDIIDGLVAEQAALPSKYFYDNAGSRLFERITCLPEYYPTRIELGLLNDHAGDIADVAGTRAALVDLGAGSCRKARAMFPALKPRRYVAVDISADFLDGALTALRAEFPEIEMSAVAADLSVSFALPSSAGGMRRLFFYPGSSIGNRDPDDAAAFLATLRAQCAERDGLLIGIDLVKDARTLHAAYNDAEGITAAFNLNLLNHVNALLRSDFRLHDWRHRAIYNDRHERIEMHLDAARDVVVSWPGGRRRFHEGESIHTENSYKYRLPDFTAMMRKAGFRNVRAWTDDRRWFAVCHGSA